MNFTLEINQIKDDISFIVNFNSQSVLFDQLNNTHIFNFDKPGIYDIVIEQTKSKPIKWYAKFGYIILSFFQALFYILFFQDNNSWIDNVIPYCLKYKVKINTNILNKITFNYSKCGIYNTLLIDDNIKNIVNDIQINYCENKIDYNLKFFHYFRKISAIYAYSYILFGILSLSSVHSSNYGMAIFCIILMIIIFF